MNQGPPRLAMWLVRLAAGRLESRSILADMLAEFDQMLREGHSISDARRWYHRQAVTSIWPLLGMRTSRATASPPAISQAMRSGVRSARMRPGFSSTVVLTLALGIGSTTAVFALIQGILLTPPPYDHPERIVLITPGSGAADRDPVRSWTADHWLRWAEEADLFDGIAAYSWTDYFLVSDAGSESVVGMRVSSDYFRITGLEPQLGRVFDPSEIARGTTIPSVIISHDLWQRRFGGDPTVLGAPLRLSRADSPPVVIGVMPPDVRFLPSLRHAGEMNYEVDAKIDFWLPPSANYSGALPPVLRALPIWDVVGRLRPGVAPSAAEAQLSGLTGGGALENENYEGVTPRVEPLLAALRAEGRRLLLPLFVASGLVLLIGCGNAAVLFLVRGRRRRLEYAVRGAMGASRRSLLLMVTSESLVLALAGGVLGIALAIGIIEVVEQVGATAVPRLDAVEAGWPMLLSALAVSMIAAVAAGLYPALRAKPDYSGGALSAGGGRTTASRSERNFLSSVISTQVALTIPLLVGSGLLVRTMLNIAYIDPGFETEQLVTMNVTVVDGDPLTFHADALEATNTLPSVEGSAFVWGLPLTGTFSALSIDIEGVDEPDGLLPAKMGYVSPGYFDLLDQAIVLGRDVRDSDRPGEEPAVVVNQTFVERYLGGSSVTGRRVTVPIRIDGVPSLQDAPSYTIVGVVSDGRTDELTRPAQPEMYGSIWQAEGISGLGFFSKHLVVRSTGDPLAGAGATQQALRAIEPTVVIEDVKTLARIRGESLATRTLLTTLLLAFAGIACVLTLGGLYGVLSLTIQSRMRELGIRVAIGADTHHVLRLVSRDALGATVVGLAAGLLLSLAIGQVLESALFGVGPVDPLTLVLMGSVFLAVAAGASWAPVRRALSADPLTALHSD